MLEGLNEQRQRELSAARSALEQWLRGAVESISSLSMRAMRELDADLALSGAPPRLLDPDDESSFDIWDEVHH